MPPEIRVRRSIGFHGAVGIEVRGVAHPDAPVLTYASVSKALNRLATERDGEWSGIPMPLPGLGLEVAPGHPWAERFRKMQEIADADTPDDLKAERRRTCSKDDMGWRVVNSWRGETTTGVPGQIHILRHEDGRVDWGLTPRDPARNRFLFGPFDTMDAWDLDTELTAIDKLATLLTERMFKAYVLSGQFLETSKRSGLTYFFRRLRPTIVMTPHGSQSTYFKPSADERESDDMRILTCLCLHPLAYYSKTFCGAMVPTDDVIAHLLLMRGDEHLYWKRAAHHAPFEPESGL